MDLQEKKWKKEQLQKQAGGTQYDYYTLKAQSIFSIHCFGRKIPLML